MRKLILNLCGFIFLTTAFLFVSESNATNYVSFNGGFYIEYPDDWLQVNYLTADAFLGGHAQNRDVLNYEAVFAPKLSSPFFENDYLILTIDTMDWLYEYREDSIVDEMKKGFGPGIDYFPSWDKPGDVKTNQPVYDKEKRILSVVNDIVEGDKTVKKSLLVRRFHDKGVANFFFYCPDSTFEKSREVFFNIVNTFGTENIEARIPKEDLRVAKDIGRDREINYQTMLIALGLGILVVAAILFRMRSAAKRKEQSLK